MISCSARFQMYSFETFDFGLWYSVCWTCRQWFKKAKTVSKSMSNLHVTFPVHTWYIPVHTHMYHLINHVLVCPGMYQYVPGMYTYVPNTLISYIWSGFQMLLQNQLHGFVQEITCYLPSYYMNRQQNITWMITLNYTHVYMNGYMEITSSLHDDYMFCYTTWQYVTCSITWDIACFYMSFTTFCTCWLHALLHKFYINHYMKLYMILHCITCLLHVILHGRLHGELHDCAYSITWVLHITLHDFTWYYMITEFVTWNLHICLHD